MADEDDEDVGHPYGKLRKGPLVFSRNEEDERIMRRLLEIEPELSDLADHRRSLIRLAEREAGLVVLDEQRKALVRLAELEPEASDLIASKRAWARVSETAKKIAIWLSTMAGGFFVLREILRSIHG